MFLKMKIMTNNRFKFRVWCPILNEWNNSDQLCLRPSGLVTDGSVAIDSQYLQFCTGLQDKNKKLIFEGDILVYYLSYGESEGGQKDNIVSSVDWADGLFVFDGDILSQSDANFFEIIGNIFEHANLLK